MSPSLRLHGATFSFSPTRALLDGVDLHLTPGWTALVGPNGAGKSTLLRILAGELAPELVLREPEDLVTVRVEQRLDAPSERVRAFGEAWDKAAVRLQSRLELPWDGLERWASLSPGERRRFQIGAALWRRPQVLLLDEPDNHLDIEARHLLVDALSDFDGIGVLISHDRALLDALTTRTVRLQDGRVDVLEGSWSDAEVVWAARDQAVRARLDAASQARKRAVRQAREAAEVHARASQARSNRGVDPRDHDARSVNRKARAANAEAAYAQAARRQARTAERAIGAHQDMERPDDLGRAWEVPHEPPRRRRLLSLTARELRPAPDADVLLHEVDVHLDRGQRTWLAGPNGAGKSTLVRHLLAASSLPEERLLVLPQELTEDDARGLLERLHALPPDARGTVLQLVAALGIAPAQLLATERPSPGEARKLALALGLGTPTWALVLDEPTHHLDVDARRGLERALTRFPGGVLLVTHDTALGEAVCDTRWRLREGRVEVEAVRSHGLEGAGG